MTSRPVSETGSRDSPGSRSDAARWLDEHGDALYRYARAPRLSPRAGGGPCAGDLARGASVARPVPEPLVGPTWLLSILRHKIVDHYRRGEPRRQQAEPEEPVDSQPITSRFFTEDGFWSEPPSRWKSPEQALLDDEFWRVAATAAWATCRTRWPSAFMLRELEQIDMEELCAMLDLSPGNLRVRLHRARLLLRDCLEKRWFGSRSDEVPTKP